MKLRTIRAGIWILVAVLAAFTLFSVFRPSLNSRPDPLEGVTAPEFVSRPIIRATRDEPSIEGIRIVNFWGSWCPPCRVEHPFLMDLAEDGYWIDGIAVRDDPEKVGDYLAELGDPFARLYVDPAQEDYRAWKVRGVPETLVVTDRGEIVFRWTGPITEEWLERTLRPVLEQYQD